jgi:hypothetical protein
VYHTAIMPIVTEVLEGFNCTIFAYGQTGTGKTYTMEGGPRNSVDGSNMSKEAGIIPRAIKQIFDAIESNDVTDSSVKVRHHMQQLPVHPCSSQRMLHAPAARLGQCRRCTMTLPRSCRCQLIGP